VGAQRLEVAALDAQRDALALLEPQQDLDLAQLRALEAAGRDQLVAEGQEFARGQRLHHLPVRVGVAQDRHRPAQAAHAARELLLGDVRGEEEIARGAQLAQHELERELEELVHGDEEHLLVGQLPLVLLEALLEREQLLDADVVPVAGSLRIVHRVPSGA